jgi:hypothetical protein
VSLVKILQVVSGAERPEYLNTSVSLHLVCTSPPGFEPAVAKTSGYYGSLVA